MSKQEDCVFDKGSKCTALNQKMCEVCECPFYKSNKDFCLTSDRYTRRKNEKQ